MSVLLPLARCVSSFVSQPVSAFLFRDRTVLSKVRGRTARQAMVSAAVLGMMSLAGARGATAQITARANTFVSGTTSLTNPFIAVDAAGNVYSVQGTNPIHKGSFSASGVYTDTTLTGTPTYPASGIAVDASGNVYVSENSGTGVTASHSIEKFPMGNGAATNVYTVIAGASLRGIAVDAGGNFYAPLDNGTLLTLTALGGAGYITTTPTDGVASPTGIAVGASGTIYLSASDGNISKLTSVGAPTASYTAATSFTVTAPATGVAVDAAGNIYGSGASGTITELPAGATSAVPFRTAASNVSSLADDASGNIYFAAGSTTSKATVGQSLPTTSVATATTSTPVSFAIDTNTGSTALGTLSNSNVLTQGITGLDFTLGTGSTCTGTPAASSTCTVNVIFKPTAPGLRLGAINLTDASGNIVATAYVSGNGTGPQAVLYPGTQTTPITAQVNGVAADPGGNIFAFGTNGFVIKASPSGNTYTQTMVGSGLGTNGNLALDGSGNLYIADGDNNQVVKETLAGGTYTQSVVGSVAGPTGVAVDGAGNVFVTSGANPLVITKFSLAAGSFTSSAIPLTGNNPTGIAVDGAGNLFVTDGGTNNVVELSPANGGAYTQGTVVSGLSSPNDVAVDAAGDLYIADNGNNRVAIASPSAGGYSVSPVLTGITQPKGVALDSAGNLYAAGTSGFGVVKLDVADTQTFTFPDTKVGAVSTSQTATLYNIGTDSLTFPVPTTGNNPSISAGFTLGSSETCPITASTAMASGALASATNCTLPISFTPVEGTQNSMVSGSLTLTDNNLNASSTTQSVTLKGTVPASPYIATINPATGFTVGGTTVTITGTDLSNATVTFGGVAGVIVPLSNTATSLTVITPASAAGPVDVTVSNTDGSDTKPNGFTYIVPSITLTQTLPSGTYGTPYSGQVSASLGTAPYTYAVTAGTLPTGLSLNNSTGAITGTPTSAGSYNFTITSTDSNGYSASQAYTVAIGKAPLNVTVANAAFTYGGTYPTLTGTVASPGFVNNDTAASTGLTYATTVATTNTSTVGTYTISASLSNATAQNNYNLTVTTGTLTINKATPVLTAPMASTITYGQMLSASTLSGGTAMNGTTTVSGSFAWTNGATIPNAGSTTAYSVTFNPTDTTDYNTATVNVTPTVNKATPTLTAPTASAITYGQTLASSTLTGGTAMNGTVTVGGSFAWTDSTIAPNAGTPSYSVTFTPTDGSNYNTNTIQVTVTVNKATPTITMPPTASSLTYGQTLSASTLTGGTASVGGAFAWTNGSTIPPAGTASYSVTFTPTDTTDYATTTVNVSVTVGKATPVVTTPPTASSITYGQTLASSMLSGGTVMNGSVVVAGKFTWTDSTIAPNAGTYSYSVTFTPTDTADYSSTTTTVSVTVNKATPTISSPPIASSIVYGATLSTSRLSEGTASTGGTFAWTNGATVPPAGTASYSVTFTPTDLADYNTTTVNVNLIVSKATPTITTPPTASPISYGATLSTSSLSGGAGSPAGTFAWTNGETIPPAGTANYTVTFTPNDTTDYNTINLNVSLTVGKATPTITALPTASAITYGQTLGSSTLTGGTGSTNGSFAWTNSSLVPNGGTASYSVTFTPTDTADYTTTTGSVSLTVNPAAQTLTFVQPASPVTYGQTTAITLSATASSNLTPAFTVISGPGTISGSTLTITGAGTIVVAADQSGNGNYLAAMQVQRSIVVNVAPQTITFTQPASPIAYGSVSTVTLSATGGGSSNPVTFSVLSGPGTISGNILTIKAAGTIIVAADQTGNANYGAAAEVQRSIVVSTAAQTITFPQPASPVTYGSAMTFTVTATGGASGSPVTFSILSGPATINGSTVTILTAGSIVVAADQTGNANYSTATEVQRTVVIAKATATLTGPASPVVVGTSSASSVAVSIAGQYSGSAVAAPGGSITYSIINASNAAVATGSTTITNGMVTVPVPNTLAAGQYSIAVNYAGDTNYAASATLTISLTVGQFQPVIVWAQPAAITYGTTLTGVLTASAQDQTTATAKTIPGTYVYLNGTTQITPLTVLPAGTYTLTVNFTPTDTATYKTAMGSITLTVNKVAPTATLQANAATALAQSPVSFVATVSSPASVPTGSVTFLDGTTTLGTVALANGNAVLTTTALTVGPHTVTAQYLGDSNFTAQPTSSASVQITDFNFSTSGSTSVTTMRGGTANYSFTLAPSGTTSFPAAVSLTVTGLPTGATYTITPQTIAAGAGSTSVTLAVVVPAQLAMLQKLEKLAPLTLALLLLPFSGCVRRRAGKLSRLAAALLLVGGMASTAMLTGCVGYVTAPKQVVAQPQPETFNIVVTATSGSLSHSTTLTLIVQ